MKGHSVAVENREKHLQLFCIFSREIHSHESKILRSLKTCSSCFVSTMCTFFICFKAYTFKVDVVSFLCLTSTTLPKPPTPMVAKRTRSLSSMSSYSVEGSDKRERKIKFQRFHFDSRATFFWYNGKRRGGESEKGLRDIKKREERREKNKNLSKSHFAPRWVFVYSSDSS